MIIGNVSLLFFSLFYLLCKSNPKNSATACLFVYNCVFFDKSVKFISFPLEGDALSSR